MPSVVPDTKGRTEKVLRSIKALMGGMFKFDVLQKEANNITKNPPLGCFNWLSWDHANIYLA